MLKEFDYSKHPRIYFFVEERESINRKILGVSLDLASHL